MICVLSQLHGYRGKDPLGLQIFIGTADERILKPHAFYQVHRITGKTVTTTSYEKIINGTKVLEIPLEPKNNMKAMCESICVNIFQIMSSHPHSFYFLFKFHSPLSVLLTRFFFPSRQN